jgi:metallophosphoesterase superfamily enzyme
VEMSSRCVPIYPYPVLFVETVDCRKFLTISDVHIGCEDRFKRAGVSIDSRENVRELKDILITIQARTGISNLIILGDLKSSTNVISKSEWDNVPYFIQSLINKFTIYLVPGNHDGNINQLLPMNVNLMLVKGMQLEDILFIHGHTVPRITPNLNKIIAGHLHPILKKEGSIINGKKVWVKIHLTKGDSKSNDKNSNLVRNVELILVPHFNKVLDFFVSSQSRKLAPNKMSKLPFLDTMLNKQNWKIHNAYIYTLDGSLVGSGDDLNNLLY